MDQPLLVLLALSCAALVVMVVMYFANRYVDRKLTADFRTIDPTRPIVLKRRREPEDIAAKAVLMVAAIVGVIGLVFLHACTAHAQEDLGAWFQSLTVPGTSMSCCDTSDCRRLPPDEVRTTLEGYEVMIAGEWMKVPDKAILPRKANPTGDAVVCYLPSRGIMCFVRPPEA